MNKAILIGNLTKDPESRTTTSGVAVCTFTVAVNRRFVNQQGVREADFINIVAWRQTAEFCARYLSKGRKVAVIGSIQTRTYDAQDGSKRYVTEVVAEEIEPLSAPVGQNAPHHDDVPLPSEPPMQPPAQSPAQAPVQPQSFQPKASGFDNIDDDELPF